MDQLNFQKHNNA